MRECFNDSLKGVKALTESQLDAAEKKGLCVSKVIYCGGFAESPSLQTYVRKRVLRDRRNIRGEAIEPIFPRNW
jgi:hypothetical protein